MNQIAKIGDLVADLCARRSIDEAAVLDLRRTVYEDGVCSLEEAEAVFRLDQTCTEKVPSWNEFYVQSLTDYFVWQSEPRGYVDDDHANFLIERIMRDGRVDQAGELELLINIIHRATRCPKKLVLFALDAVRRCILEPETAAYGSNRPPTLITAADAAIIRKIIHAPAGDGSITVTRREAELIFDLNDASQHDENAPEWRDLFVRAIANHLMFPREAPIVPSADEVRRQEAWLNERRGVGSLLTGVGKSLARRDIPFKEAWREVDPFGYQQAQEEAEAEERRTREALSREAIDAGEAAWLVERLMRNATLDENERALLQFIRGNSPHIDPALDGFMRKHGV